MIAAPHESLNTLTAVRCMSGGRSMASIAPTIVIGSGLSPRPNRVADDGFVLAGAVADHRLTEEARATLKGRLRGAYGSSFHQVKTGP